MRMIRLCWIIMGILLGESLTGQLFQLQNSKETGIHFNNEIIDTKDQNILLYSNYYGGAGVGIGDFNNDGLQDVFFAGNLVEDKLYYNTGNFQFNELTKASKITQHDGWSSGVVVADFNNDGWQDIYVTRELYDEDASKRKNKLYINSGVRSKNDTLAVKFFELAAQYNLDDSERTRHAAVLDYDKDGKLDIFLLNQPPNPGNYSPFSGENLRRTEWAPRLMRNNGDNYYVDVTEEAGVLLPCYPNSMVACDFNKDGWQDIYITNDYEAPDLLYQNMRDGTFREVIQEKTNHISYYAMGVDAADLDNDLWPDFMTLDMVAEDNFRLKSNMSGMNPSSFYKILEKGGHYQYMYNVVHKNNEGKSFSDVSQITGMSSTDWSWSNIIADFDNDGNKDVYITNGLVRDIRNTDGDKKFGEYVEHFIQEYLKKNPNAGDVELLDILPLEEALSILPSVPLRNYAYRNNGKLNFTNATDQWGFTQPSFSNGCAYADLDNDGDLDIIVSNINAEAFVYKNTMDGKNNYLDISLESTNHIPTDGAKCVITLQDGSQQYYEKTGVRGMYSSSQNFFHFGVGKNTIINKIDITLADGQKILKKDIHANQKLRIVIDDEILQSRKNVKGKSFLTKVKTTITHKENEYDDYAKQILLPHKMSHIGPASAIGDINMDGLDDIYVGASVGETGHIQLQQKDGTFTKDSSNDFSEGKLCEDIDATFIDIDGDLDLDLYIVSGGNEYAPQSVHYQDRLYVNKAGVFQLQENALPRFRESGSVVRPYDYDQDGDLDLFIGGRHQPWSYPSPTSSRLLQNTNGIFIDVTVKSARDLALIGMVTDAEWTDYDNDGDKDIILVGAWMPILVLVNDNGIFHKEILIENSNGWWNSISIIDGNKDGLDDYLLGNLGLNYKYKASLEEPFEVFYDDFDSNGTNDIVLSYYNFGEQFPLRGRSCSAQQIPELQEQFPSYNIFANTTLEHVYGNENLDNALHYSAFTFASSYIENKSDGKLNLAPFPNSLQLSAITDFEVADYNEDGQLDFIAMGNNFQAEIETPRNDAGIGKLVLNGGKGAWTVVSQSKSGIHSPTDVRRIESLLIADKPAYLIVNNNSTWDIYNFNINSKPKNLFRE